jgi:hypothetical protein
MYYASIENAGTYLSVQDMENAANVGLFAVLRIFSERMYAYMEKTQRDIKIYISVNNNANFNFIKILFIYTI